MVRWSFVLDVTINAGHIKASNNESVEMCSYMDITAHKLLYIYMHDLQCYSKCYINKSVFYKTLTHNTVLSNICHMHNSKYQAFYNKNGIPDTIGESLE